MCHAPNWQFNSTPNGGVCESQLAVASPSARRLMRKRGPGDNASERSGAMMPVGCLGARAVAADILAPLAQRLRGQGNRNGDRMGADSRPGRRRRLRGGRSPPIQYIVPS